jgi:hypothetical protein
VIELVFAAGLAAALVGDPPAPTPPIHVGMSCAEAGAIIRSVQRSWPFGEEPPRMPIACQGGKVVAVGQATSAPAPRVERTPNFYKQPARCGPMADAVTRRVKTATGSRPAAVYAVNRTVDGCAVPAPIGYHPDYLLPGAADPQSGKAPSR